MALSSQNTAYQTFKTVCLVVFFLQFPLAAVGNAEFLNQAYDPYFWGAFVFVAAVQLFLLYTLLTKNPAFGMLAAGYCGILWLIGFISLLLDAWAGALSPVGVQILFFTMQWWLVWFFFFHAVYL